MLLFNAYKLESQEVEHIEVVLNEMRVKVKKRATREYIELLAKEVQSLVDDIALNMINRPNNVSLFSAAQDILNSKIAFASSRNLPTKYNFEVSVHVMFYEGNTYFKLNAANDLYSKEIGRINGLICFHCKEGSDFQQTWLKIAERYSDGTNPLGVNLSARFEAVKPEQLKFDSPKKRAKLRARYQYTNRCLSMLACGKEIPNYKLMEYLDEALEKLSDDSSLSYLNNAEKELRSILPNITAELISYEPECVTANK